MAECSTRFWQVCIKKKPILIIYLVYVFAQFAEAEG